MKKIILGFILVLSYLCTFSTQAATSNKIQNTFNMVCYIPQGNEAYQVRFFKQPDGTKFVEMNKVNIQNFIKLNYITTSEHGVVVYSSPKRNGNSLMVGFKLHPNNTFTMIAKVTSRGVPQQPRVFKCNMN